MYNSFVVFEACGLHLVGVVAMPRVSWQCRTTLSNPCQHVQVLIHSAMQLLPDFPLGRHVSPMKYVGQPAGYISLTYRMR